MDKVNELTKSQENEDKLLIAKVLDKLKFVNSRNRFENTDFLDLSQQNKIKDILERRKENTCEFWGGYDEAERTMLIIFPNEIYNNVDRNNIYNQIMQIARITLPKELWGTYEHKTYLGALMKLGLKREKIGDIIVRHDGADIIISKDLEKFITNNLNDLTRFQKAKIEILELEELKYVAPKKEIIKINVPSMRLDCIIGELARCSRNEASEIIEQERVFVDFKEEIRGTRIINESSYITIRGKGRFKINKILGTTKSGRYSVEIEK